MNVAEIISMELPVLAPGESGENALILMEQYDVNHLPVVSGELFMGVISEEEILLLENPSKAFNSIPHDLMQISVDANAHLFDALSIISNFKLSILPVVTEGTTYVGAITAPDLLYQLTELKSVKEPGGVLVLEMSDRDYSLTEIARLVEENDAKILSSSITSSVNQSHSEVTLKINRMDLSAIIQTFERYDYHIKASYQKQRFSDSMKDRYEELMKYLNI
ncbi:MAG: CBS domain-containing protein [Flavobacteriales bacterium]